MPRYSCAVCGSFFVRSYEDGDIRAMCPSCQNQQQTNDRFDKVAQGQRETTDAVRETTDAVRETTDAVRETTDAVRETTEAVHRQTSVMATGFAATVDELRTQRRVLTLQLGLLSSIDATMRSAVGAIASLREDLYATTKNREALEAKSKLERAEVLVASDLPRDALKLILEAEQLNPADFTVWYAKASICQLALRSEPSFMEPAQAREQGVAALDRAIKLFPKTLLQQPSAILLTSSLTGSSIILDAVALLDRSFEYCLCCVESAGPNPNVTRSVAVLVGVLEGIGQVQKASLLVQANIDMLARSLRQHGATVIEPVLGSWQVLESLRGGSAVSLAAALSAYISCLVSQLQEATLAMTGRVTNSWPPRSEVQQVIEAIEQNSNGSIHTLSEIRRRFAGIEERYPPLRQSFTLIERVLSSWCPNQWRSEIRDLIEFPPFSRYVFVGLGLPFSLMFSVLIFDAAREGREEFVALAVFGTPVIGAPIFVAFGLIRTLTSKKQLRTKYLVDQIAATASAWTV